MAKIRKVKLPSSTSPFDIYDAGAVRFDESQSLTTEQKAIARANIGVNIDKAMNFIGRASKNITDGSTTDPGISGYSTKTAGDIILNKDDQREFIWDGTKWEELGKEGDYKIRQSVVSDPSASGSTTAFIDSISQNENGVITVTKKNLDLSSKADVNHSHSEYAASDHSHREYATVGHSHSEYAAADHSHSGYASSTHTHNQADITQMSGEFLILDCGGAPEEEPEED